MSKKLITFSLWGNDPKYCEGALKNIELARIFYPGWTCRFYVAAPDGIQATSQYYIDKLFEYCSLGYENNVEVVMVNAPGDWRGMFWRFYPASEDDVDVFISRDCDSRLSEREALAVEEWMKGPKLIHVMRDHPYHTAPIMGGMWGAKNDALPNLQQEIEKYKFRGDFWQVDQDFLREIVWPAHYHKILAHDDWRRFPLTEIQSFPTPRQGLSFVGEILDANDLPIYPEHNQMLEAR